MTTNNHPAHGPVSLDRLRQISEILSKAAAQSDGGNLGYAMADAVKVIDEVLELRRNYLALRGEIEDVQAQLYEAENRNEADATELQERRKADSAEPIYQLFDAGWYDTNKSTYYDVTGAGMKGRIVYAAPQQASLVPDEKPMPEASKMHAIDAVAAIAEVRGWNACRAAMLQAGNSPVIPDGYALVPIEPTMEMLDEFDSIIDYGAEDSKDAWSRLIAAAPQQEVK